MQGITKALQNEIKYESQIDPYSDAEDDKVELPERQFDGGDLEDDDQEEAGIQVKDGNEMVYRSGTSNQRK